MKGPLASRPSVLHLRVYGIVDWVVMFVFGWRMNHEAMIATTVTFMI